MKKVSFITGWLLACVLQSAFSQATEMEWVVDFWRYQDIRFDTYNDPVKVDIIGKVEGAMLDYQPDTPGWLKARINLRLSLYKLEGADTLLQTRESLTLQSDAVNDTTSAQNFPPISFRKTLPQMQQGTYLLSVYAEDFFEGVAKTPSISFEFILGEPAGEKAGSSDIAFTQRLYRILDQEDRGPSLGRNFQPLLSNQALVNQDTLFFFVHFYNLERAVPTDSFIIKQSILQGNQVIFSQINRKEKRPFNLHQGDLDITRLPSHPYYLLLEIWDSRMEQVFYSVSKRFYVSNSREESEFARYVESVYAGDLFNNFDERELDYYLRTLQVLSSPQELIFARALDTYQQKRNYLYSFWNHRKQEGENILDLWKGYLTVLSFVNKNYVSGPQEGWQSDRGKVMLKYGAPNDIRKYAPTPEQYGYETWHYDRLDNQSDILFVFIQRPTPPNHFQLIHSNKYGEQGNEQWYAQLTIRDNSPFPR